MITEFNNGNVYYLQDDENPFLMLCTTQRTETAPILAERLKSQGISAQKIGEDVFEVFNAQSNPMTSFQLMSHVHEKCADIISADEFFDEDMQDNQLRVVRALGILADMP